MKSQNFIGEHTRPACSRLRLAVWLLISALCSLISVANAAKAKLSWDFSPSTGVTNYILYAHTNALTEATLSNAVVRIEVGTNLTARVENLQAGRWYFVATAMMGGFESAPSNMVNLEVPEPPANMRTIVVQYAGELGSMTNFFDVGFFRLRLP